VSSGDLSDKVGVVTGAGRGIGLAIVLHLTRRGAGVVAVDPTVIPLGTRMYIPGYGPGIAADTGTAIKGLRIDLWFPTLQQTYEWGKRTVTITLR